MNPQLKRWLGFTLIIVSIVSLVLSAGGFIGIWALRQNIVVAITDTAALFADTLTTTDKALTVAQQTLANVHQSIATTIGTTQSIATSLRDGQPAVKSTVGLIKQDLPNTIGAASTAINSAAQTARAIDDLLNQLAKVPLINLDYRPDVPLATAITNIGVSLNDLPDRLSKVGGDLETLSGDLAVIANQVDGLGVTIQQFDASLGNVQSVLRDYQNQLARALSAMQSVQTGADRIITLICLALTFVLLWIAVTQIIVLVIGWRWFKQNQRAA